MKLKHNILAIVIAALACPTLAGEFDGSQTLLCATQVTQDCSRGEDCLTGLPEEIGAPTFMRLDFAKKAIVGPHSTSAMLLLDKSENQLVLQGRESGFAWTIVVDRQSGELTSTLTNRMGAYVMYGACTTL